MFLFSTFIIYFENKHLYLDFTKLIKERTNIFTEIYEVKVNSNIMKTKLLTIRLAQKGSVKKL